MWKYIEEDLNYGVNRDVDYFYIWCVVRRLFFLTFIA